MAKVTTHNGATGTTASGMSKYRFAGSPTDQFEHIPAVGECRTMKVTVECVAVGDELVVDGTRHVTKWRVLEAEPGTMAKRPDNDDPQLPYDPQPDDSGPRPEYGDYAEPDPDEDDEGNVTPMFSS